MLAAKLTSKGQITIPKAVRDSLGINTGDKLEFVVTDKKEALVRPVSKKVDDVFGRLHKTDRKAVSLNQMEAGIQRRLRDKYK